MSNNAAEAKRLARPHMRMPMSYGREAQESLDIFCSHRLRQRLARSRCAVQKERKTVEMLTSDRQKQADLLPI